MIEIKMNIIIVHNTTPPPQHHHKTTRWWYFYIVVGSGQVLYVRCWNSVWEIAVNAPLYARLRWKVAADLLVDLLAGLAHRLLETAINGKLPRVAENGFEADLQKITLMVLWITCRLSQRRSSIGVFRLGVDLQNGWLV